MPTGLSQQAERQQPTEKWKGRKRKEIRKRLVLEDVSLDVVAKGESKTPGANCSVCPLLKKPFIGPNEAENPVIYYAGEAPAEEELRQRKVFTGPSGQLLKGNAEEYGLDQYPSTYDNVVSCYGFTKLTTETKVEAIRACSPSLAKRIIAAKKSVKLIVPLGNTAKSILLPGERKGIRGVGGQLFKTPFGNVMPVIHPASVLYESSMYPQFLEHLNDVRLFFAEAPAGVSVEIVYTREQMEKAITALSKHNTIAVDLETTSFSAYETEIDYLDETGEPFQKGRVLCVLLSGDGLTSYVIPIELLDEDEYCFALMKKLLQEKKVLCHNGEFDVPFLLEMGIKVNFDGDTMLQSYSMGEHPFHSLKRLSRMFYGVEDWSKVLKPYLPTFHTSYANVPKKILFPYGGRDVAYTHRLKDTQYALMRGNERKLYEDLLMPCARMFTETKHRGVLVDLNRVMTLKREWEARIREIMREARTRFGLYSHQQTKRIMAIIKEFGIAPDMVDAYMTDMYGLEYYAIEFNKVGNEEGLDFVDLVTEWRELEKALNTNLVDIARNTSYKDLCIHPDTRLTATVTGRLVMQRPTLLNFPIRTRLAHLLRSTLIPRPGYVWVHYDQKQFELRVYASFADDKKMKAVFAADRDPHDEAGKMIHGERYDADSMRGWVKTVVFGRLYGRGAAAIAEDHGSSLAEAKKWCDGIDSFWSGIGEYREGIQQEISEQQELINPLGRARRWPIITSENLHSILNEGYNFKIQSTANDLNLLSQLFLHEQYRDSDAFFAHFPFHDAIEAEVQVDKLDTVMQDIKETLASAPERVLGVTDIKFKADESIGATWGEATSKAWVEAEVEEVAVPT